MKPYYKDQFVTIYHGTWQEFTTRLPRTKLLLTDPPYGLDKKASQGSGKLKNRILNESDIWEWDSAPSKENLETLINLTEKQIIWGGNYFELPPCRGFLIWDKKQPWENFSQAEFAWTSFDFPSKIIAISKSFKKEHPTQKPLHLMKWCIDLADLTGEDVILDPYAGSGTTGRAAKDLGYHAILIEKDEKFCEISAKRMEQDCLPLEF